MSDDVLAAGAWALRDMLRSGEVSALAVTEACLSRVAAREDEIRAWAWIDPDSARAEARALDKSRGEGVPAGPLHGLPVGLKDVIDTGGIPTENGCPADRGRVPEEDAAVVARLRAAGAVVLGKTVTTELAFLHPSETRNPANPAHTPGGSSSGSAAAVAAGMVPLAVGTQTGGSVIRPASFCGVTGFKPSFGAIPRRGTLLQSHSLDTLGVFAADVAGAALLAEALVGPDPAEAGAPVQPAPGLAVAVRVPSERPPRFGVVRLPGHAKEDPEMSAGIEALARALGPQAQPIALPAAFEAAAEVRRVINLAEMAHHFARYASQPDRLGAETAAAIAEGAGLPATRYLEALEAGDRLVAALAEVFVPVDVLLCPAALGPAPHGFASTGDSIYNGLWTMCGTPAITVPLMRSAAGLPMGVQLVGPVGEDAALLRAAAWLEARGPV